MDSWVDPQKTGTSRPNPGETSHSPTMVACAKHLSIKKTFEFSTARRENEQLKESAMTPAAGLEWNTRGSPLPPTPEPYLDGSVLSLYVT